MKKKPKVLEGQTCVSHGVRYTAQELFVADGVRWVLATHIRKVTRVKHKSPDSNEIKQYIYCDRENHYFSELEWLRMRHA